MSKEKPISKIEFEGELKNVQQQQERVTRMKNKLYERFAATYAKYKPGQWITIKRRSYVSIGTLPDGSRGLVDFPATYRQAQITKVVFNEHKKGNYEDMLDYECRVVTPEGKVLKRPDYINPNFDTIVGVREKGDSLPIGEDGKQYDPDAD